MVPISDGDVVLLAYFGLFLLVFVGVVVAQFAKPEVIIVEKIPDEDKRKRKREPENTDPGDNGQLPAARDAATDAAWQEAFRVHGSGDWAQYQSWREYMEGANVSVDDLLKRKISDEESGSAFNIY